MKVVIAVATVSVAKLIKIILRFDQTFYALSIEKTSCKFRRTSQTNVSQIQVILKQLETIYQSYT